MTGNRRIGSKGLSIFYHGQFLLYRGCLGLFFYYYIKTHQYIAYIYINKRRIKHSIYILPFTFHHHLHPKALYHCNNPNQSREIKKEQQARKSLDDQFLTNINKLSLEERIKIESEILFIGKDLPPLPFLNLTDLASEFINSVDQERFGEETLKDPDFLCVLSELLDFTLRELRNICLVKKMLPKVEALSNVKYYCLMEDHFNEHPQNFILLLDYCFGVLKEHAIDVHNELIINVNMIVEYVNTYKHTLLEQDFLDYLAKKAIYFK